MRMDGSFRVARATRTPSFHYSVVPLLRLYHVELVDLLGHRPSPHQLPSLLSRDRVPETDAFGHEHVPLPPAEDVPAHRETRLVAPARQLHLVVLADDVEVNYLSYLSTHEQLGRRILCIQD